MSDLKITIEHLKNYLGTGLKVYIDEFGEGLEELNGIIGDEVNTNVDAAEIVLVRPVCYRMSDLDKFIPELGFVPIEELLKENYKEYDWFQKSGKRYSEITTVQVPNYIKAFATNMATLEIEIWKNENKNFPFWITQRLFSWYFWPFGERYFDEGLVIDKIKQAQNA